MTFGGHERELGRQFLGMVQAEVRRIARPIPAKKTVIDFASLGGDAGFIGAAGVARLGYLKHSH
jgi:glucokinase